MKRLRLWCWDYLFIAATRLSNWALVRRALACGCEHCGQVAILVTKLKTTMRSRPGAGHPRAAELN